MGVRGVLVYCADYHCGHSIALSADRWSDFNWSKPPTPAMGYRNTKSRRAVSS
jgi:hypothetical protein